MDSVFHQGRGKFDVTVCLLFAYTRVGTPTYTHTNNIYIYIYKHMDCDSSLEKVGADHAEKSNVVTST